MKRLFCITDMALLALGFSGCQQGYLKNEDAPPPVIHSIPPGQTGELLKVLPLDPVYAALCDNSGMSGSGQRTHYHNNNASDMYAGSIREFIFDIGHMEQLGEVHVWNYNSGNGVNGLNSISVLFSEDNSVYRQLGVFTLRQANGAEKLPATDLTDDSVINFNGKSARYIKILPLSNYGGGLYGLSEIKFYRYRNSVYKGAYIAASPIYKLVSPPVAEYYNLTNGAGLSDPTSPEAVHDNNPNHMYYSNTSAASFDIDLQGRYPIEKIVIWNYNGPNTKMGLGNITVSWSDDTVSWTVIGSYSLPEGTGQNKLGPSLAIPTAFAARYVRVSGMSIGGANAGLSAIRCYVGDGWYTDYLPDWTALFSVYPPDVPGWSGADGIYSVNLDGKDYDPGRNPEDKKTFFIFSDTLTTTVNPVTGERGTTGRGMPNNTRGILSGSLPDSVNMNFNINAIKIDPPESNHWYWLGDTFVIGNKLYIYTMKIAKTGTDIWGFSQIGLDLASFDILNGNIDESSLKIFPDANSRLSDVSAGTSGSNPRWFLGSAVFENTAGTGSLNPDGYIYVYGYHDNAPNGTQRRLIVARVKAENAEDFTKYEYLWYDNTWKPDAWGPSSVNPKFLGTGTVEFSIHEVKSGTDKGKFWMIAMPNFNDKKIILTTSDSPAGTFGNPQTIFYTTDPYFSLPNDGTIYAYNAKAHPAISPDNELYISYNVNGGDIWNYADIYRPRFLRYAQVPLTAPD